MNSEHIHIYGQPKASFLATNFMQAFSNAGTTKENFKWFNYGRSIDCDPITFSFYADVVDKI